MLARSVLCRLAGEVPSKTSTHDLPQLSRLVQRALLNCNATSCATSGALAHSSKLALSISRRRYATAAATKSKPAKKVVKKAAAPKKTTATKKTATTTKKAAPKKKAPAKKTRAKAKKPAATPRRRAKKELTPEQKERQTVKALKEKALRDPKLRPATPWMVFVGQEMQGKMKGPGELAGVTRAASEKYKNLSAAEREHYNHLANQAKAANDKDYQAWVNSHTVEQIYAANLARFNLRRRAKAAGGRVPASTSKIVDERQIKKPSAPYTQFCKERHASGDFKSIRVAEAGKLLGEEWKALSASEKKKYEDAFAEDLARYKRESSASA